SLQRELDFREEAANIERVGRVLAPYGQLGVPQVYERLSTARLLVLEEIAGVPVREAPAGAERLEAARQLLDAYYRQILGEGFFHADPPPGNMLWWRDRGWLEGLTEIGLQHGIRAPASLALAGKAFAQVQLTVAELDPTLDPFEVFSRHVLRGLVDQALAGLEPGRALYEAQKLRLRLTRLVDALERVTGARPGPRLQVDFRGTLPLERRLDGIGRRLALAATSGSARVASG